MVSFCRIFFAWYRFHWSLAFAWLRTASVWVRCPSTVTIATSTARTLIVKLTGRRLGLPAACSCCSSSSWASWGSMGSVQKHTSEPTRRGRFLAKNRCANSRSLSHGLRRRSIPGAEPFNLLLDLVAKLQGVRHAMERLIRAASAHNQNRPVAQHPPHRRLADLDRLYLVQK